MLEILIAFVFGLVAGLVTKGVNINIVHKPVDNKEKEYYKPLVDHLPPEIQNYYNTTNGHNLY